MAENMHGHRYTEVIREGDSSVFHTMQPTVIPYGKEAQKVEYTKPHCQMFLKPIRAAS